MSDTMRAVHDAVFAKLTADLLVPVFDDVPQNQPYPFVSIDRHITDADDTYAETGQVNLIWLAVWSDHAGRRQVLDIMGAINASLHDSRLTLALGTAISVRVETRQTNLEPDGETYQGAVRVRVLSED